MRRSRRSDWPSTGSSSGSDSSGSIPERRGAALTFLKTSLAILSRPDSVLWITAQGEFVNPRERPIRLKPGIGHLIHRLKDVTVVTLAIEYPFWNDRCPEVADAIRIADLGRVGPVASRHTDGPRSSRRRSNKLRTNWRMRPGVATRTPSRRSSGGQPASAGCMISGGGSNPSSVGRGSGPITSAGRAVEDGPHPGSGSGRTFNG